MWWVLGAALVLLGWLGYSLLPILTPFVAAILLTYICHPAQAWLLRRGLNANVAAILVMLGLMLLGVAFLLVLLPLLFQQLRALYDGLVVLFTLAQSSWLPRLQSLLGVDFVFDIAHLKDLLAQNSDSLKAAMPAVLKSLSAQGGAVMQWLANFVLTPVVFFYLLRDAVDITPRVLQLVPPRYLARIRHLLAEVDDVLGQFLRGQLTVMLVMAVIYSAGLWLVGLQAALPVGLISGLLTFIPYVGATLGLLLGVISAFTQFDSLISVWSTLLVFLIGQMLESNLITPKLVGERIGLHPVAVIFALMAFGQLFGFIGVLLALPMAAVLLVGFRHAVCQYQCSRYYRAGKAGVKESDAS